MEEVNIINYLRVKLNKKEMLSTLLKRINLWEEEYIYAGSYGNLSEQDILNEINKLETDIKLLKDTEEYKSYKDKSYIKIKELDNIHKKLYEECMNVHEEYLKKMYYIRENMNVIMKEKTELNKIL